MSGDASKLVDRVIVGLPDVDVSGCDFEVVTSLHRQVSVVRGWADALELQLFSQADVLAAAGEGSRGESLVGKRRGRREAKLAGQRAATTAQMPELGEALAAGEMSTAHLDVVTRAGRGLDDAAKARLHEHAAELADLARSKSPDMFERSVRDLTRTLTDDDGLSEHERHKSQRCIRRRIDSHAGMLVTELHLDAETDAKLWTKLRGVVDASRARSQDPTLDFAQFQIDAILEPITGATVTVEGRSGRPVPEVSVLIDWATLINGLHAHSVAETSEGVALPVATIRRLCCDANIVPVVLGGDGEVLDVGISRRLANRAQRRALQAMHRTCAHPECTVKFDDCVVHHVRFWTGGAGPTDLHNLLPLCGTHHHLVHEGGWTLTLEPDRTIRLIRPDGIVDYTGPSIDRTPRPDNPPGDPVGDPQFELFATG